MKEEQRVETALMQLPIGFRRREEILGEIGEERSRQIAVEGYVFDDDDAHDRGELALMAASYAVKTVAGGTANNAMRIALQRRAAELWPFLSGPKSHLHSRRELVIAAALLVAEIERLDRAEARKSESVSRAPASPQSRNEN